MLISGLRVLLGTLSMFFALGMIAPAVVFSGGAVCLRCIFMMFGSLVVFVLSHSLSYERPRQGQSVGGSSIAADHIQRRYVAHLCSRPNFEVGRVDRDDVPE